MNIQAHFWISPLYMIFIRFEKKFIKSYNHNNIIKIPVIFVIYL